MLRPEVVKAMEAIHSYVLHRQEVQVATSRLVRAVTEQGHHGWAVDAAVKEFVQGGYLKEDSWYGGEIVSSIFGGPAEVSNEYEGYGLQVTEEFLDWRPPVLDPEGSSGKKRVVHDDPKDDPTLAPAAELWKGKHPFRSQAEMNGFITADKKWIHYQHNKSKHLFADRAQFEAAIAGFSSRRSRKSKSPEVRGSSASTTDLDTRRIADEVWLASLSKEQRFADIRELDLSSGINAALHVAGIESVGDRVGKSRKELADIDGIGLDHVPEIISQLEHLAKMTK